MMQDQPQPIPRATLDTILPPNRDRCFFENSDRHPFRYTSSQFELINAWWLAEASLLAYDEESYVKQKLCKGASRKRGKEVTVPWSAKILDATWLRIGRCSS